MSSEARECNKNWSWLDLRRVVVTLKIHSSRLLQCFFFVFCLNISPDVQYFCELSLSQREFYKNVLCFSLFSDERPSVNKNGFWRIHAIREYFRKINTYILIIFIHFMFCADKQVALKRKKRITWLKMEVNSRKAKVTFETRLVQFDDTFQPHFCLHFEFTVYSPSNWSYEAASQHYLEKTPQKQLYVKKKTVFYCEVFSLSSLRTQLLSYISQCSFEFDVVATIFISRVFHMCETTLPGSYY